MTQPMGIGKAIWIVRKARGLTQEDFSDISSRTYLSSLERNLKSPTLDKLAQLAVVLQVHPVTLVALSTLATTNDRAVEGLLALLDDIEERTARLQWIERAAREVDRETVACGAEHESRAVRSVPICPPVYVGGLKHARNESVHPYPDTPHIRCCGSAAGVRRPIHRLIAFGRLGW